MKIHGFDIVDEWEKIDYIEKTKVKRADDDQLYTLIRFNIPSISGITNIQKTHSERVSDFYNIRNISKRYDSKYMVVPVEIFEHEGLLYELYLDEYNKSFKEIEDEFNKDNDSKLRTLYDITRAVMEIHDHNDIYETLNLNSFYFNKISDNNHNYYAAKK